MGVKPRNVVGIAAVVTLLACGGQSDVEKACREALVLAQIFDEAEGTSVELETCVHNSEAALEKMSGGDLEQAEACIACIARTSSEECGCCTTDGKYDVVHSENSSCQSECDTPGHTAYCELR